MADFADLRRYHRHHCQILHRKLNPQPKSRMIIIVSMTSDQIVEEARCWPPEKVGELVGRLTEDLHVGEPEIDAAW